MCIERAFGMLKSRWRILLKRVDVHLKNVPDLVSMYLLLHNICIIFGDTFWKNEWLQEATDKIHDALAIRTASSASGQERLAVANNALHTLAGIDENSRESLEYLKQKCAREFEIAMSKGGKTAKEFCARRNGIARSLWMAKTKACVAQMFPTNSD